MCYESMKNIFLLILIGICLSTHLGAQSNDFYNSFADDQSNFDPELLMLEPHYNADGTIDLYTMAGILKVEYERNKKGQPTQKTMSVFDQHDYEWEKQLVTNYEYKEGRLVREILFSPKGLGWSKSLIDKKISYDPVTNTDTVRVENNIASMYSAFPRDENKESYTVRYYNRENTKIDSVLQVSIYRYNSYDSLDSVSIHEDILKQKVIYDYDRSGRIKGAKSYRRSYDNEEKLFSEWEEIYSFEVNYNKNEIEYVQRGTYLYRDEDEDYWGGYKERTDITRFRIVSDDKGRITRKQVTIDDDLLLDAQYSFDDKGRLSVLHEQNVTDRFMEIFGSMGLNTQMMKQLGDKLNYLKYTLKQVDNCQEVEVYLKEDDEIRKVGELKFCKLEDGRPCLVEIKKYDEGELDDYEKVTFNYKEDGCIEKTEYNYVSDYTDEDTVVRELVPYKKTIVKKDNNRYTIYEEVAHFDDETKKWKNESKEIYEYNEKGFLLHEERYIHGSSDSYHWSSQSHLSRGDTWIGREWIEREYDNNENMIGLLKKSWDGEKWINYSRSKYSFDEFKNRTYTEEYSWDKEIGDWKGYRCDSTAYNSEGKKIRRVYYKWLPEQKKWRFEEKQESEKKDLDQDSYHTESKDLYSEWVGDEWVFVEKREKKTGKNNDSELRWKWDNNKGDWYLTSRYISQIEGNTSHYEYANWDEDCNCLEGKENTTTILLNDDDKRFIHRVWNYETNTWKDTISVFELRDYERSLVTSIYELYNEDTRNWDLDRMIVSKIANNEDGSRKMELEKSLWNNKENRWIRSMKIDHFYIKGKEEDAISEIYKYNNDTQSFEKIYRTESIKIKKKEGEVKVFLSSVWNKETQKWDPVCAKDGSGWYLSYYKWDTRKQKLVPAEYSEIQEIQGKIDKAFDAMDTYTDYANLVIYKND